MVSFVFVATATFLLAGFVKGVTGLGLPVVAMGLLSLAMPPGEAAALLVVPALVTNLWQMAIGRGLVLLLRRLWPMLLAICLGTWVGTGFLVQDHSGWASVALGGTLALYAILGLADRPLHVPGAAERWLSPIMGGATGVVSGATGVFSIPAVPYLQALRLDKEELVQALGLSFTTSTLALAAGLLRHGLLPGSIAGASAATLLPALAGLLAGQWVRRRIRPEVFQLCFFIALFMLGGDLVYRALK